MSVVCCVVLCIVLCVYCFVCVYTVHCEVCIVCRRRVRNFVLGRLSPRLLSAEEPDGDPGDGRRSCQKFKISEKVPKV